MQLPKFLIHRIVRNGFRKANILQISFTAEDGVCNPETSFVLTILRNKDMVILKLVLF